MASYEECGRCRYYSHQSTRRLHHVEYAKTRDTRRAVIRDGKHVQVKMLLEGFVNVLACVDGGFDGGVEEGRHFERERGERGKGWKKRRDGIDRVHRADRPVSEVRCDFGEEGRELEVDVILGAKVGPGVEVQRAKGVFRGCEYFLNELRAYWFVVEGGGEAREAEGERTVCRELELSRSGYRPQVLRWVRPSRTNGQQKA